MKNRIIQFFTLFLTLSSTLAYAQKEVSLRDFQKIRDAYRNSPDPQAEGLYEGDDISYIKDVNNELDQFTGTWTGTYNNQHYEISLIKKIKYKRYSGADTDWDLLVGWITVKDDRGNLIYTNKVKPESYNGFKGDLFRKDTQVYSLNFTGNCYNDSGNVLIYFKADGKMRLKYGIRPDMLSDDCPGGFTPVLPLAPNILVLTKKR